MEIPRIEATLLRISTETVRADPSLGLSLGQQLVARVVSSGGGLALLDLGGRQLQARTAMPLVPGQQVQLQVTGLGPEIAMRLLGASTGVSDQHLALATLATAHQAASPPAVDLTSVLRALESTPPNAAPPELRARLAHLLGGLPADANAAQLAGRLRDVLEHSGLLFETRVRAWLQAHPEAAAAQAGPLPPTVAADLKVLLGVLARAMGLPGGAASGAPTTPAPPPPAPYALVGDGLRQYLQQWAAASAANQAGGAPDASAVLAPLREAVLARQVEAAYHWVRDGTLALDLPLVFDGREVLAHLRFRRGSEHGEDGDAEQAAGGKEPAGVFFDFALDPPGLGPLRAQAHLAGPRLAVRFLAASADTARLIGDALPALRASLEQAGLSLAHAEATVDPDGARPVPLPSPVLPRGGSVLDARA